MCVPDFGFKERSNDFFKRSATAAWRCAHDQSMQQPPLLPQPPLFRVRERARAGDQGSAEGGALLGQVAGGGRKRRSDVDG